MDESLVKLTNPPFDIEWNGKIYSVRKATLVQFAEFQRKAQEFQKSGDPDFAVKLVGYALFLVLKIADPSITYEMVLDTTPANAVELDALMNTLGFTRPTKTAAAPLPTSPLAPETSSSTSPTEQGGVQTSSGV
jgi:hypothetical protein